MAAFKRKHTCHVIDFVSRQQRRVAISTFAAELLACVTVDRDLLLTQLLHEVACGVMDCNEARRMREIGGYEIPPVLYADALSIYAAIAATFIKTPAERALDACAVHTRTVG